MTDQSPQRCSICNTEAFQQCARCRQMWYCSKACQIQDWKVHKLLCSKFAAFETHDKPNWIRAILFKQDVDCPQFVWLPISDDDEQYWEKLLSLPGDPSDTPRIESYRLPILNASRERSLRHSVILMRRCDSTMDGSVPNEAVVRLTNRKLKYDWCGPIIITAQTKIGISDNYPYEDVSLHDFRDIVDYFLSFDGTSTSTMMMQVSTKSRAVRIRCQAHMIASKAPKFSVENTNNIFLPYSWKPTECCVTLMIKLPLYLAHIPPDVKWGSKVEELINHTAACLELGQIFSEARRQRWYQDGGDAIVARADSRDLLPEHLEVLADFCEVEIVGLLTKAASNPSVMNTLKSVCTEHVTEKKFKLYWEKYQTKMSLSDPRWSSIPSPYY